MRLAEVAAGESPPCELGLTPQQRTPVHPWGPHAAGQFTDRYMYDPKFDPPNRIRIDFILLQKAAAMVEELKEHLEQSFEVRMVTDIFMEWEEIEAKDWPGGKAEVLRNWTIEN